MFVVEERTAEFLCPTRWTPWDRSRSRTLSPCSSLLFISEASSGGWLHTVLCGWIWISRLLPQPPRTCTAVGSITRTISCVPVAESPACRSVPFGAGRARGQRAIYLFDSFWTLNFPSIRARWKLPTYGTYGKLSTGRATAPDRSRQVGWPGAVLQLRSIIDTATEYYL